MVMIVAGFMACIDCIRVERQIGTIAWDTNNRNLLFCYQTMNEFVDSDTVFRAIEDTFDGCCEMSRMISAVLCRKLN